MQIKSVSFEQRPTAVQIGRPRISSLPGMIKDRSLLKFAEESDDLIVTKLEIPRFGSNSPPPKESTSPKQNILFEIHIRASQKSIALGETDNLFLPSLEKIYFPRHSKHKQKNDSAQDEDSDNHSPHRISFKRRQSLPRFQINHISSVPASHLSPKASSDFDQSDEDLKPDRESNLSEESPVQFSSDDESSYDSEYYSSEYESRMPEFIPKYLIEATVPSMVQSMREFKRPNRKVKFSNTDLFYRGYSSADLHEKIILPTPQRRLIPIVDPVYVG